MCSDRAAAAVVIIIIIPNLLSGILSTKRCNSQIRKEDHDPYIFTSPAHTIAVRQNRIHSAAKMGKCAN